MISRNKNYARRNNREDGNVLFYILIAVALLAALSYAVSSSGRNTAGGLGQEKANMAASEILEYANTLGNAVTQLKLRGTEVNELCFDSPVWGNTDYNYAACADEMNQVFHVNGGGAQLKEIPEYALSTDAPDAKWRITGSNEVEGVGTTCAGDGCADLIMRANFVHRDVCIAINNLLGVGDKNAEPPTDDDTGGDHYIGVFSYMETLADEAGGAAANGKNAACLYQTGGTPKYFFYKVLIAR